MIKNFRGGGEGVVDEKVGSSERCLKWGGGGSLRDLSINILKQCHHPCPPENFNYTLSVSLILYTANRFSSKILERT